MNPLNRIDDPAMRQVLQGMSVIESRSPSRLALLVVGGGLATGITTALLQTLGFGPPLTWCSFLICGLGVTMLFVLAERKAQRCALHRILKSLHRCLTCGDDLAESESSTCPKCEASLCPVPHKS